MRVVEADTPGEFQQRGQLVAKPAGDAAPGFSGPREHRWLASRQKASVLEHDTRDALPIALRALTVWWQGRILSMATLGLDASIIAGPP